MKRCLTVPCHWWMMIQISTRLLVQAYATQVQMEVQSFMPIPRLCKKCIKVRAARVVSGWPPFYITWKAKTRAWLGTIAFSAQDCSISCTDQWQWGPQVLHSALVFPCYFCVTLDPADVDIDYHSISWGMVTSSSKEIIRCSSRHIWLTSPRGWFKLW